jgi:hypothetical protein
MSLRRAHLATGNKVDERLDDSPRVGDEAVAAADLRCFHPYDRAGVRQRDAVAFAGRDQDAIGTGFDVPLAEVLDRRTHAAGGGSDEVGQLGDS